MPSKHSCHLNINSLSARRDASLPVTIPVYAVLLFFYFIFFTYPQMTLTPSLQRAQHGARRRLANGVGRRGGGGNKWSLKEGDDIVIHHQIIGCCCWTNIQREQRPHILSLHLRRPLKCFDCYCNYMYEVLQPKPILTCLTRPVAKELLRGPDRLANQCRCAKNSGATQISTRANRPLICQPLNVFSDDNRAH